MKRIPYGRSVCNVEETCKSGNWSLSVKCLLCVVVAGLYFVWPMSWILEVQASTPQDPHLEQAQKFFERYVSLEHAFDPAIADLYANDAYIQTTRHYPLGWPQKMVIPADQYKWMMRRTAPLARSRGDRNRYSDCTFTREGERVRIRCTRFSELKKYESPIEWLVGPGSDSQWLIFEEISETRP